MEKHSIIKNKNFYFWLKKNYKKILKLESKFISTAIIESIKIKAHFVKIDENEILINDNSRAMLNFGHTFGHALEMINNYNPIKRPISTTLTFHSNFNSQYYSSIDIKFLLF